MYLPVILAKGDYLELVEEVSFVIFRVSGLDRTLRDILLLVAFSAVL
jgi:hypothetical protein